MQIKAKKICVYSPVSSFTKSPDKFVLVLQLNNDFLTEIENWTISAGTENLLVQTSLASLALRPQVGELGFQSCQVSNLLLVDFSLFLLTVLTDGLSLVLQGDLAADASHLLLGEGREGANLAGNNGLGPRVISLQQNRLSLTLAQNWLEYSEQWFAELIDQARFDRSLLSCMHA